MRIAALLSLLIILALSDGVDCQNFTEFKRKHILPINFKTKNKGDWEKYLWQKKLCDRTAVQSFIKSSENSITQICDGSGNGKGNYTKSEDFFEVYILKSSKGIDPKCIINDCTAGKYNVIVKCEKNLPVHYHGQDIKENTQPWPCFHTP